MDNLCPRQPSIQKLVSSVANDAVTNLAEETTRTDAFTEGAPQVKLAVDALRADLSPELIDQDLLSEALHKSVARAETRERKYAQTVSFTLCVRSFQVPIACTGIGYCRNCTQTNHTCKYWC
jgi:hypothetical protein